jgi:cytolysin (calcineurin-like family phosphatase)
LPEIEGQWVLDGSEVIGMTDNEPLDKGADQGVDRREQARAAAEKMVAQLQVMIDQTGKVAGPVLRDVAAKAAELAAIAAENAGPVAHKAADVTEHVGDRLAVRSRDLAKDLHKAAADARAAQAEADKGQGPQA